LVSIYVFEGRVVKSSQRYLIYPQRSIRRS
jgi:hypothetical protein